jgi:dihydropyrimidinase
MTDAVLDRPGVEGAKWMCSPPQRTPADQAALWAGLARGDLALVSSDHAPYRFDASGKLAAGPAPGFDRIANGLPGLGARMPLMFDAMLRPGGAGLAAFVEATAGAAAREYGLGAKGRIVPGADADLVIWDPARSYGFGADDLHDNAGYNPWEGRTVTGWPERVLLRGATIVEDGRFLGTPGQGRWLARGPVPSGAAPAAEAQIAGGMA